MQSSLLQVLANIKHWSWGSMNFSTAVLSKWWINFSCYQYWFLTISCPPFCLLYCRFIWLLSHFYLNSFTSTNNLVILFNSFTTMWVTGDSHLAVHFYCEKSHIWTIISWLVCWWLERLFEFCESRSALIEWTLKIHMDSPLVSFPNLL